MRLSAVLVLSAWAWTHLASADSPPTLPNTAPMEPATGDERSKAMVASIDRFSEALITTAAQDRTERWKRALADDAGRSAFKTEMRQKLRACLGMVDDAHRVPHPRLEVVASADETMGAPLVEGAGWTARWVRWAVFDGVTGEGLLFRPKGRVLAQAICIPDAETPPLTSLFSEKPQNLLYSVRRLAAAGCEVVAPLILDRSTDGTGSDRFQIHTNLSHREWIHRQAYLLGRTLPGYEIAKIFALADALGGNEQEAGSLGILGLGDGGWLALQAAALDERFKSVWVAGCFASRDHLWEEPLDRTASGYLNDFDAAEMGALILPRRLQVSRLLPYELPLPAPEPLPKSSRLIAAPGQASLPPPERIAAQAARIRDLLPGAGAKEFRLLPVDQNGGAPVADPPGPAAFTASGASPETAFLQPLGIQSSVPPYTSSDDPAGLVFVHLLWDAERALETGHQREQMRELQSFTQARIAECEQEREVDFWKKLPLTSLQDFGQYANAQRHHFWNDLIGKLPDPNVPLNPRSCLITENEAFAEYDVVLDVWPGVTAWGYLLVPKNIAPGEKRPVVVCQHGLEGLPEDTVTEDPKAPGWKFYKGFAAQLARQGFITFAPHNFYRGKDAFRVVQRKLNLTGKTLYSVIIAQHQSILQFLQSRPEVDASRIAFYGLSYGGKSAMRIPAALPGYCLSICSGDFNEWVRKCVSLDLASCYVYSPEYEIWEWNLARTFNYAEMAALIAPRPFMVERGHGDGVGLDEWVGYEYAKVRRMYDRLGIGDRTQMEVFDGPHTIHGVGTYQFLHDKLK